MMLLSVAMLTVVACGDDDEPEAPKVSISLRSCSITEGMEYQASALKEVTAMGATSGKNLKEISP